MLSVWRPILRGMASVLDLAGALGPSLDDLRRPGETGARTDARALASDWRAVGDDLREAMLAEYRDGVADLVRQVRERDGRIAEVSKLATEMHHQPERP